MTLSFPNASRYFDEKQNAIGFVGHDGMFEIRFFVAAQALAKPDATIDQCLSAFEATRSAIYDAASKAYARNRRSGYVLTAADLR